MDSLVIVFPIVFPILARHWGYIPPFSGNTNLYVCIYKYNAFTYIYISYHIVSQISFLFSRVSPQHSLHFETIRPSRWPRWPSLWMPTAKATVRVVLYMTMVQKILRPKDQWILPKHILWVTNKNIYKNGARKSMEEYYGNIYPLFCF